MKYACISLILFFCVKILKAQESSQTRYFSRANYISDIKYLIKKQEGLQVNAYKQIAREVLIRKADSLISTLSDSVSIKLAFTDINYLAALYNQGHVYVEDDKMVFKAFESSKIFPLNISSDSFGNLYVIENYSTHKRIEQKTKILSINGNTSNAIFNSTISLLGGLLNYRVNENNKYFAYNLFLRGYKAPFIITYKKYNSETLYCDTLQGMAFDDLKRLTKKKRVANYSYKVLDNKIGYLNFKAMYGKADKFKDFLDSCFIEIKERKIKSLIVDLRYNSGGDSELGDVLLSYLTDKPYRLSSGTNFKVSEDYQIYMQGEKEEWNKDKYSKYQNAAVGKILYFNQEAKNRFPLNMNRADLKTCFLIGPGNFSSATMLADGAQSYKLATLIGQPTGAPANDSGEVYSFSLPNTGFVITAPVSFDIRANGKSKDLGAILPNIYVQHDLYGHEDLELIFAKNWMGRDL